MARKMTPQERAAELAEQISGAHHQLAYPGATVRSLVFDALQETRRAALLEAAQVAITYGERARDEDLSGGYTSELIAKALDRLAQEEA